MPVVQVDRLRHEPGCAIFKPKAWLFEQHTSDGKALYTVADYIGHPCNCGAARRSDSLFAAIVIVAFVIGWII